MHFGWLSCRSGQSLGLVPSEMAAGEESAFKPRGCLQRGPTCSCQPCNSKGGIEGPQVPMSMSVCANTLKRGHTKGLGTRSSLICLAHAQGHSSSQNNDLTGNWAETGIKIGQKGLQ